LLDLARNVTNRHPGRLPSPGTKNYARPAYSLQAAPNFSSNARSSSRARWIAAGRNRMMKVKRDILQRPLPSWTRCVRPFA